MKSSLQWQPSRTFQQEDDIQIYALEKAYRSADRGKSLL